MTDRDERNKEIKRRTEGGREGQGWTQPKTWDLDFF